MKFEIGGGLLGIPVVESTMLAPGKLMTLPGSRLAGTQPMLVAGVGPVPLAEWCRREVRRSWAVAAPEVLAWLGEPVASTNPVPLEYRTGWWAS